MSQEDRIPLSSAKSLSEASLKVSDISITGNNIEFRATLTTGDKEICLPVSGRLSSGFQAQNGFNSIVVEVFNNVQGGDFLLFRIFNDSAEEDSFITSQNTESSLNLKPHIKIYLEDENNVVYLFETAMPDIFSNLNAKDYQPANPENDLQWGFHLAQ